jgi:hypothetical protein
MNYILSLFAKHAHAGNMPVLYMSFEFKKRTW